MKLVRGCHEVGKRTGTSSLWRQGERAGAVQPREGEVMWRPLSACAGSGWGGSVSFAWVVVELCLGLC